MSAFRVICPECHKKLILKDRSQIGRKSKCPKCGHRFILALPKDSESEDASAGPQQVKVSDKNVSDNPPRVTTHTPENGEPLDLPKIDIGPIDPSATYSPRSTRRSQRSRRLWIFGGLASVICGLGAATFLLLSREDTRPLQDAASGVKSRPVAKSVAAPKLPVDMTSSDKENLQLLMVPSGARLIVNLRPAELWSDDAIMTELRECLTENMTLLIEKLLREVTHREPQQIEEVLLAWILGARGTDPQLASVVHLVQEERLSDLIEEFGDEPLDELAHPKVYLHGEQAVFIRDRSTLAFAPRELAEDMSEWVDMPNHNTSDGILTLLNETDRNRLLTVICEPADVTRHIERLFPKSVHTVARASTSWFADLVETMAWSVETGTEFRSEFILRGPSTQSASTLETAMTSRIQELPSQLSEMIGRMQPTHSGVKKLISRFPAMLEVSRQATSSSLDHRIVKFQTTLPTKAGPNLALASVLTWAESTRLPLSEDSSSAAASASNVTLTISERLELPVDAEFNRTPLQEALDYIAGEIKVPISIDGDALKDAGYTKNMPQTFNLGTIPAREALWEIVKQYQEDGKQMVLVVNEEERRAVIKTQKFADAAGETPFDLTTVDGEH